MLPRLMAVCYVLFALLSQGWSSVASADAPSNVTLTLDKTPGDEAIRRVLRAAGVNFAITDDVLRTASKFEVTKSFKDEPFKDAFEAVLRATRDGETAFRYRVEDTVRIVFQREASAYAPPGSPAVTSRKPKPDIKITIKFNETPLRDALQQIFDKAGVNFILPDVGLKPAITMSFADVPLEGALTSVLQSDKVGLRFSYYDGTYVVHPQFAHMADDSMPLRMSARIDRGDIRYALKAFFICLGMNYTLDQSVHGDISIGLKKVNPRTVLEAILLCAPQKSELTYRVEDRVYIVTTRQSDQRQ